MGWGNKKESNLKIIVTIKEQGGIHRVKLKQGFDFNISFKKIINRQCFYKIMKRILKFTTSTKKVKLKTSSLNIK